MTRATILKLSALAAAGATLLAAPLAWAQAPSQGPVARWEGMTLVIDSVNYNDQTWLAIRACPMA
jgi:hypothetical protein